MYMDRQWRRLEVKAQVQVFKAGRRYPPQPPPLLIEEILRFFEKSNLDTNCYRFSLY